MPRILSCTLICAILSISESQARAYYFDSWPLPLSQADFQAKSIDAFSRQIDLNDFANLDKLSRAVTTFASVLHAWNPDFKTIDLEQAIAAKTVEQGLWNAVVKPQVTAINVAYTTLPDKTATKFAAAMLAGIGEVSPQLKEVIVSELNQTLGHGFQQLSWEKFGGDVAGLRDAQREFLQFGANLAPHAVQTRLASSGAKMPPELWSSSSFQDYRNPLFGPSSLFEKSTGFAANGSLSADGMKIARTPNSKPTANLEAASAVAARAGNTKASRANKDWAVCVTKCFDPAVIDLGAAQVVGVATESWLKKTLSAARSAAVFPVAALLALNKLNTCENVVCKEEKQKAIEELRKVQKEEPEKGSQTKTGKKVENNPLNTEDCTRVSSPNCNRHKADSGSSKFISAEQCYENPSLAGCGAHAGAADCSKSPNTRICSCVREGGSLLVCASAIGDTATIAGVINEVEALMQNSLPEELSNENDNIELLESNGSQSMSDRTAQLSGIAARFQNARAIEAFGSIRDLNETYFEKLQSIVGSPLFEEALPPETIQDIREELNRWTP